MQKFIELAKRACLKEISFCKNGFVMSGVVEPQNTLKRDSLVMGLVGTAHFSSHFYQLSLAPLFPILHQVFNVNYVTLGSVMTAFYLVSGICQAFAGIFVDRFGARPILIGGIITMASCLGLAGLVTQFWMLYPLLILAGIGNSVFHPADFSALTHRVSKRRLGRAYSIHASSGTLGYASSPIIIGSIAAFAGWRTALIAAGILGWIIALLLIRFSHHLIPEHGDPHAHHAHVKISYRKLITMPALLFAFAYFLFTSGAGTAFQTFSTASFIDFYKVGLSAATGALSTYLICSAIGMLLGGVIADHTSHHVLVAAGSLLLCAALMGFVASGWVPFSLVALAVGGAGLCQGITTPSRDILVKGATPPGSTGRVFGFVYSGLDAGSMIAPLIFGALVDHHAYHEVFAGIAAMFAIAIFSVITIGQHQVEKYA